MAVISPLITNKVRIFKRMISSSKMSFISQDVFSRVVSEFSSPDEIYRNRNVSQDFYQAYLDRINEQPTTMLEVAVIHNDVQEMDKLIELLYKDHLEKTDIDNQYGSEADYGFLNQLSIAAIIYNTPGTLVRLIEIGGIDLFIDNYPDEESTLDLIGNPTLLEYLADEIYEDFFQKRKQESMHTVRASRMLKGPASLLQEEEIINDNLNLEQKAKIEAYRDPNALALALRVFELDLSDELTSYVVDNLELSRATNIPLLKQIIAIIASSVENLSGDFLLSLIKNVENPLDVSIEIAEKLGEKITPEIVEKLEERWGPDDEDSYPVETYKDQFKNPTSRKQLVHILALYDVVQPQRDERRREEQLQRETYKKVFGITNQLERQRVLPVQELLPMSTIPIMLNQPTASIPRLSFDLSIIGDDE